ncbi:hypothetical protein BS47DRAFT_1365394 [Hydnum rufescens UP504]|uniref:Uncharacterized protein n=1 Tax=Hydnum rufescens UP504 TaxID=1448309 RepID=A0A9P6APB1_9AGAM|nr:hypothetical protein BS47DRAFT_1365394 [Hydnum rufescens UP504]
MSTLDLTFVNVAAQDTATLAEWALDLSNSCGWDHHATLLALAMGHEELVEVVGQKWNWKDIDEKVFSTTLHEEIHRDVQEYEATFGCLRDHDTTAVTPANIDHSVERLEQAMTFSKVQTLVEQNSHSSLP